MSTHATYSPSSSKRWMNCAASAEAVATLNEDEESDASMDGTSAHAEIERCLGPIMHDGLVGGGDFIALTEEPNLQHPAAHGIGLFTSYIYQLVTQYPGRCWVEQRVYLTDKVHGTLDFGHWHEESGTVTIADYKNGYTPVDATAEQLAIYAAALIFTMRLPAVKWVRLVVVQPNDWRPFVPRVKQIVIEAGELHSLASRAAAVPDGPKMFNPGEHCRYCPLFGRCDATRDLLQHLGLMLSHPAKQVPLALRAKFLACRKPIEDYFKALDKAALGDALRGEVPEGMKIVATAPHRAWRDEAAARKLVVEKFGTDVLDIPTPAQIEERGMDVSALAYRPEGGPALAFTSDKRKPFVQKSVVDTFKEAAAALSAAGVQGMPK